MNSLTTTTSPKNFDKTIKALEDQLSKLQHILHDMEEQEMQETMAFGLRKNEIRKQASAQASECEPDGLPLAHTEPQLTLNISDIEHIITQMYT
jgi:TolA-binding protein